MGTPYVGEIRMFAGNFAPAGWMLCQGQTLPSRKMTCCFNLIGTTYGGDGQDNLQPARPAKPGPGAHGQRRRRIVHHRANRRGGIGYADHVANSGAQPPPLCNSGAGGQAGPQGGVWAQLATNPPYSNVAPAMQMAPTAIGLSGGSQPHDNMVPFLAINFIISLFGIFPSQT